MKKKPLSPEQAFRAMSVFLHDYYQRTQGQAAVGDVLGDIQLGGSGETADPAAWDDWLSVIETALADNTVESARKPK